MLVEAKELFLKRQLEINSTHINEHVASFNSVFINFLPPEALVEIVSRRPLLTSLHFGLLVQASCQYLWLQHEDEFRGLKSWGQILPIMMEKHQREMVDLVVNKNISITDPRRYVILRIVNSIVFEDQPVTILDIGSGFIPLGIGTLLKTGDVPLPDLVDVSAKESLNRYCLKNNNIQKIIATDVQLPDASWVAACGWLSLDGLVELNTRLSEEADKPLIPTIEFRQLDIVGDNIDSVKDFEKKVDLVMMSNIRYQL